jgi:hypothetical protein
VGNAASASAEMVVIMPAHIQSASASFKVLLHLQKWWSSCLCTFKVLASMLVLATCNTSVCILNFHGRPHTQTHTHTCTHTHTRINAREPTPVATITYCGLDQGNTHTHDQTHTHTHACGHIHTLRP